jgi:spectinomycin phosphotransferase
MIEKPNIEDEKIIIALHENYSIQASEIEFLPIGNDASSFAYHVEAKNGNAYFLKVKRGISNLAGLFVPRFLQDNCIEQVLAPLLTKTQKLSGEVDEFSIILYPFVTGNEAMKVGMTDSQWTEFGSVLRQIHVTELPSDISQYIERESFVPKWSNIAKELHERVNRQDFDDLYQEELATFWKENNETIRTLVERTEMIGKHLQQTDIEFFLCHSDIHTANILITPEQNMFIVDWDGALFAPKERDLMFVVGSKEDSLFFKGYGRVQIDLLALAYYRYEWCIQEIGDYAERVFLMTNVGENTKRDSVERFIELFERGDVVDTAFNTPINI